jgi:transcriptional regulator with XRE-family HTH domain
MTRACTTRALTAPTILRYRLGAELRKLREDRGLRLEDVAGHLGVAPSTLSRIETGKAPTRTSYLALMLDLYGVNDAEQRRDLTDLAREGQRKGWWAEYDDLLPDGAGCFLGLEAAATTVCTFAVQAVPGLLQTADYARAVIRAARPGLAPQQIEALAAVTMRRREIPDGQRELHAVIDESALLRVIGSADVMAAQLDYLVSVTADPLITVQVLRLAASAHVLCPGFTVLTFAGIADTDAGCLNEDAGHVTVTSHGDTVTRLRDTFTRLSRHADSAVSSAALIKELRKR